MSFNALGTVLSSLQGYFSKNIPQSTLYPLVISLAIVGAIAKYTFGWDGIATLWDKASILGQLTSLVAATLGFLFLAYVLSGFQSSVDRFFQGQWSTWLLGKRSRLALRREQWDEEARTCAILRDLHGVVDELAERARSAKPAQPVVYAYRARWTLGRYTVARAADVKAEPVSGLSASEQAGALTGERAFKDILLLSPVPANGLIPADKVCRDPDSSWIAGMAMVPIGIRGDRLPRELAVGDIIDLFDERQHTDRSLNPGGSQVLHIEHAPPAAPDAQRAIIVVTVALPPEHARELLWAEHERLTAVLHPLAAQVLPADGVVRTRRWLRAGRLRRKVLPDALGPLAEWLSVPTDNGLFELQPGTAVRLAYETEQGAWLDLGTAYPIEAIGDWWVVALYPDRAAQLIDEQTRNIVAAADEEASITVSVPEGKVYGALTGKSSDAAAMIPVAGSDPTHYVVIFRCTLTGSKPRYEVTIPRDELRAAGVDFPESCEVVVINGAIPETWNRWPAARQIKLSVPSETLPKVGPTGGALRFTVTPTVTPTVTRTVTPKESRLLAAARAVVSVLARLAKGSPRDEDVGTAHLPMTWEGTGIRLSDPPPETCHSSKTDTATVTILTAAVDAPTVDGWSLGEAVRYGKPRELICELECWVYGTRTWEHRVRKEQSEELTAQPEVATPRRAVMLLEMLYEFDWRANDPGGRLTILKRDLAETLRNACSEIFYRYDQQLKHFNLYYPRNASALSTTMVGNIQYAVDSYCTRLYGLDSVLVLPRLLAALKSDRLVPLLNAKQQLEMLEWGLIDAILVAVVGEIMAVQTRHFDLAFLIWFVAPWVLWAIHKALVNSTVGYADALRVAVDFERGLVLSKLGLGADIAKPIGRKAERKLWNAVRRWWEVGRAPASYAVPSGSDGGSSTGTDNSSAGKTAS